MLVHKLSVNIDGHGGKLHDRYFYTFNDAFNALSRTSGFFYDEEKEIWDIEGTKETRVEMSDDNCNLYIRGIVFPYKEMNEYCIRWAEASIERIDIDGKPNDDTLYVLRKNYGYKSYMNEILDSNFMPNDYDPISTRTVDLLRTFSKNYVKKYARSHVKSLPRIWNNKEEESEINYISGNGRDYLSISEFKIQ